MVSSLFMEKLPQVDATHSPFKGLPSVVPNRKYVIWYRLYWRDYKDQRK